MKHWYKLLLVLGAVMVSPQVLAHDNNLSTGLLAGLSHPLTGIDHLVALILAGVLVGRLVSGQRLAMSGLLFMLGLGAIGGILFGAQAWVEAAIFLSVPVFFALQWIKYTGQMKMTISVMSFFMIAHGWVHGVEMAGMDKSFIFGFLLSSAIIMGLSSMLGARLGSNLAASSHV